MRDETTRDRPQRTARPPRAAPLGLRTRIAIVLSLAGLFAVWVDQRDRTHDLAAELARAQAELAWMQSAARDIVGTPGTGRSSLHDAVNEHVRRSDLTDDQIAIEWDARERSDATRAVIAVRSAPAGIVLSFVQHLFSTPGVEVERLSLQVDPARPSRLIGRAVVRARP